MTSLDFIFYHILYLLCIGAASFQLRKQTGRVELLDLVCASKDDIRYLLCISSISFH